MHYITKAGACLQYAISLFVSSSACSRSLRRQASAEAAAIKAGLDPLSADADLPQAYLIERAAHNMRTDYVTEVHDTLVLIKTWAEWCGALQFHG